jgi:DNA-binding transcriptional MerR regulator
MDRSYRIGEFAELAGVTVRALHHYDRIGLLRPQRSASGTRLYSLADLERLEQIAALKFLGIPLQEIKLLLKHGPLTLVESLHVQLQALAEKRNLINRAIVAIEAAEKVIRAGQTTDASILRKIIEVIDMQPQENFMRKYYTEQAWAERAQLREHWEHAPAETRERWAQASHQLFTEVEAAVDLDPASEVAQAITRRWLQFAETAHGGNDAIRAGNLKAWNDWPSWPPEQQDRILAGFGLDLTDRATSMHRWQTVTNFIGRTIGYKVQTNLRSLYELDPLPRQAPTPQDPAASPSS